MKINIGIEATPQEMREFLGLPNVYPLQEEMLQIVRDNMRKGVAGFDPLQLMKPLLPVQSMEMMQKAFWDTLTNTGRPAENKAPAEASATEAQAKRS